MPSEFPEQSSVPKSIFWFNAERLFRLALGFYQVRLVARYLGAGAYGDLSAASALASTVAVPAALGLENVLTRQITAGNSPAGIQISSAVLLRTVSGTIGLMGCIAFAHFFYPSPLAEFSISASFVCIAQAPLILECWFRSKVDGRSPSIAQMGGTLIGFSARVMIVSFRQSALLLAMVPAVEAACASLLLLLRLQRAGQVKLRKPDLKSVKSLILECWPALVASVGAVLFARIDVLMMRSLTDEQQTGHYAAALRMVELTMIAPVSIVTSLTPSLIKAQLRNYEEFESAFVNLAAAMLWLGIILALALIVLAPFAVRFIFGHGFEESGTILKVLAWNLVPASFAIAWGSYWLIQQQLRTMALLTFVGAALLYVGVTILIPKFGGTGAALSTVGTQTLLLFMTSIFKGKRKILAACLARACTPLKTLRAVRVHLHAKDGTTSSLT